MIETERLILKPVTIVDFDIYKDIMSCPMMSLYLPKGEPYDDEEILQHVSKRVEHWKQGFGSFVVYLKHHPNVKLGYAGIEVSPNFECSDIRFGFKQDAQGKGYAYEAAKSVLEHTFALGLHTKIYGVAVKENIPSIKILEKLDMNADYSVVLYDDERLVTLSVGKSA
ncbi:MULTISPECIES: GNAT family N-acetyltransferase [unclassified Moritella]|uniref:GNAT family N-acetyltransferase n=1 Tax=unclassified Moritella TaxID=2637987 RepID=UPI001BAD4A56|nr:MULTISPECIES: GNAT family N-acetyltransferase [unclassified Moritella]QUM85590.1 GNAT family N-acetyltransferase [Moritella sp. 28]QUM89808.1 GNAT family N-acetyltransferase [Moritella sp. 36]